MSRARSRRKPALAAPAAPMCRGCGTSHPLKKPAPPPRITDTGRRLATVTYATRWSTATYLDGRTPRTTPMLRLRGDWLADAGFAEGRRFEVVVEEGKLILRAL